MSEKQEQKNEDIREFGQVALNNNRENNRISLLTIIGGRNPAALKSSRRRR